MQQIASLEQAYNHARQFASSLAGYLRTMVDIEIISADQLTYGEYILSLPTSTALFLFSMKPLEGNGVLEINPGLIRSSNRVWQEISGRPQIPQIHSD